MVENKHKEVRDLRGSLGSRELSSHRDMQTRNLASTLRIFSRFYTIMKGIIFRRDVIAPDLLSARGIVDKLSTESLNARGFSTQQRGLQSRNAPEVPSETVARDTSSTGDDFIAALLHSRDSDITPEDSLTLASLASRAFDEVD